MIPSDTPLWLALVLIGAMMTCMVALRYFLASGLFTLATVRARPGLYAGLGPQMVREIRWSLLAAAIYGIPAGATFYMWRHHGWTQIYWDISKYPVWYLPLSAFLYLAAQDAWFYWTHRAMHHRRVFPVAHAVHHASKRPTAWTAMSFHPIESLTGAIVVPVLAFCIPIHLSMIGVVLLVATVQGVTNHLGWEIYPRRLVHSRLGNWLITASHHEKHHEDYRCNYGLYFRFWDRVCGTDRGLSRRIEREPGGERSSA